MGKYKFSPEERYGLWIAGGKQCFYCGEPLAFSDIWIDHILPESLSDTPDDLENIISDYGLDNDFEINSYGNWIAAHARCNRRKGKALFEKGPALYNISIARERAESAEREAQKLVQNNHLEKAYATIRRAISQGSTTEQTVKDKLSIGFMVKPEELVITFGILLENVDDGLDASYYHRCDLLEHELTNYLSNNTDASFYHPEASTRDGETLSVRLAFNGLDLERLLEELDLRTWQILEIGLFSDIYPSS